MLKQVLFLRQYMGIAAIGLMLGGCGGGTPPAPQSGTEAPAAAPVATALPEAAPAPADPRASVDPKRLETKWIGEIPYDVFYDKPWEVASDATVLTTTPASVAPVAPGPETAMAAANTEPAAVTPASEAAAGGSVNWGELMPAEVLNTEIKVVRSRLQTNLQTLRNFNTEAKNISNDGAYLAALAGVAERHSEGVNWKANARFVRDLAYKIYSNAEGTGRAPFEATQIPFEQLCTILDGGPPPSDLEAEELAPFGDVAYLNELMKWIEPNFSAIKANVNTDARMKEDPELLERQLRALMAVGRIMGDESYQHSAESKYQGFVNDFVDGHKSALIAAQAGDFEGFQAGLNRVQTSCAECHPPYRGGDSGF